MNTPLSPVSGRLASLDILRGFDLFLLVFFQPVFVALGQRLNFPWLNDILYQFDYESWIGFRFWDLVMPLFLFMTGASLHNHAENKKQYKALYYFTINMPFIYIRIRCRR